MTKLFKKGWLPFTTQSTQAKSFRMTLWIAWQTWFEPTLWKKWNLHHGRWNKKQKIYVSSTWVNKCQLSYPGAILLHFKSAERLDMLKNWKTIHILESHGLEYKANLVDQAYVSVSVQTGKHFGVIAFFAMPMSPYKKNVFTSVSYVNLKWLTTQREKWHSMGMLIYSST